MAAATLAMIENGEHRKGDVLAVARLAGIQAAKHTALLIPLCHTILITGVQVDFEIMPDKSCIKAIATVKTTGQTGVEMEALTAVNVALLTIYDMCKAVDRGMIMRDIAC